MEAFTAHVENSENKLFLLMAFANKCRKTVCCSLKHFCCCCCCCHCCCCCCFGIIGKNLCGNASTAAIFSVSDSFCPQSTFRLDYWIAWWYFWWKNKQIQAALVIPGFAICGFDYSQTRKHGKTTNNEGKTTVLA